MYDKSSSFRELLERDKSVIIHEIIFQVLLTVIFKVKNGVGLRIMTENFKFKDHSYDLRNNNCMEKSSQYVSETVSNLGAKLWDILSGNIKNIKR